MTETLPIYTVKPTAGRVVDDLTPRQLAVVIAVRRALLIVADALAEYAHLAKDR